MKVLYHIPHPETLYAGRTIYHGYRNAFKDFKHEFRTLTADDNPEKTLLDFIPDILITSLHPYFIKSLDLSGIRKYKKMGGKIFVNTPFWKSPLSKTRVNESRSLSENTEYVKLIKSFEFGDVYYNICEQDDPRMAGFEETTGYKHQTIPLAADRVLLKGAFDSKYQADISYVGTFLPTKREFFKKNVFPMSDKYKLKIYGQDWTKRDRILGWIQKAGQYFNVPGLKSIRKPKLALEDEGKIYASSTISINVHEDYQRKFGGDCNERTFKIPACGGFEICDNVAAVRKYFSANELVVAENGEDWYEKIDYYINNPDKRLPIARAGREKVLAEHTYHNRVEQIINIYNQV